MGTALPRMLVTASSTAWLAPPAASAGGSAGGCISCAAPPTLDVLLLEPRLPRDPLDATLLQEGGEELAAKAGAVVLSSVGTRPG